MAQPGRAPALGAGGRGFESRCPDQQKEVMEMFFHNLFPYGTVVVPWPSLHQTVLDRSW